MHVDQPGVCGVPVAPDLFEQRLPAQHLPGPLGQRDQQVELQGRQVDRGVATPDGVAEGRNGQVADAQLFAGVFDDAGVGTQPGPHTGHQLFGLEGFGDVVVGALLQAADHVDGVGASRQHDDGDAGQLPDLPTDPDAVQPGQHHVKQHQRRLSLDEGAQGLVAGRAPFGFETLLPQDDLQHLGQCGIVVDHQDQFSIGPWPC